MQNMAVRLQTTDLVVPEVGEEDMVVAAVVEVGTEGRILHVEEDLDLGRILQEEDLVPDHHVVEDLVQNLVLHVEDLNPSHLRKLVVIQTLGHQDNNGQGLVHQNAKVDHQQDLLLQQKMEASHHRKIVITSRTVGVV